MKVIFAPCGIDCTQCDAFIVAQNNDTDLLKKMADNFEKKFDKKIDAETLKCDGCPSEGRHIGFCSQCGIRACAFGKGYNTCAECELFPCKTGSFIWVETSKSKANLEAIKKQQ
jgi:hypothetical protein